jgi:hypothetical protein
MNAEQDTNPYEAPSANSPLPVAQSPSTFFQQPWVVQSAWILAVAINLPVPIMFGFSFTAAGAARLGMLIGVAVVYGIGVWICLHQASVMWRLIVGSMLTALSQIWPMLHMMVGAIAMGVSKFIFDPERGREQIEAIPEVVLTTLLTGIGLIVPSLVMGLIVLMLFSIRVFDEQPALPGTVAEGFRPPAAETSS